MAALSSKKILQEKNTSDPNSITSLTLTHKALTDVSCLVEFKNLEKLDLGFNNLTSLEGLKSCRNLKWLSVVQNKLLSLKGIDGLSRLTNLDCDCYYVHALSKGNEFAFLQSSLKALLVLNVGKNKLTSMDDVKSLSSLRALIMNDNEISSVCKLDQMKELNTLVLSRNPIRSLGESLVNLKSITKLSLSNCQLQKVDSSLRSCLELKELRLAHNEITTIPTEIGHLVNLQNLDLGNNAIARWSNLKVLSSLVNLRNLNLQGNPLAEKENLLKKVKKLLPNLQIFNARPIDKITAKEGRENAFDFTVEAKQYQPIGNEKAHPRESTDGVGSKSKRKELQDEKVVDNAETTNNPDKKRKKQLKLKEEEIKITNDEEAKDMKHKKKKSKGDSVNITDTGAPEDSFEDANNNLDGKMDEATDTKSVVVTYPTKMNKKGSFVDTALLELSHVDEIGLGGPSAWDI